jgi:hypothetical protein
MRAEYILRFDDLCPTMNWDIWSRIEANLFGNQIKPIVAIIPDNCDDSLKIDPYRKDFWTHVRNWQDHGWTIGLHGFQHRYSSQDCGVVGIQNRSEFAGLPYEKQNKMIQAGLNIFRRHGINPDLWVAPSHSFDFNTIKALKASGINTISDGLFFRPGIDQFGMLWIPQQMWRFSRMPAGIWTICLHHNNWNYDNVEEFRRNISEYLSRIGSFSSITKTIERHHLNIIDYTVARVARLAIRLKQNSKARGGAH